MKKGLQIISVIGAVIIGAVTGGVIINKLKNKVIDTEKQRVNKFKNYYNLLNQWMMLKQEGKSIESFFIEQGYKSIAIYGMGEMGNRLYDDLKNTSIVVKYAIDKNAGNTYSELNVIDLEDELEEVDAVIVSAIFVFNEVKDQLSEKIDSPIISLEEIIFSI